MPKSLQVNLSGMSMYISVCCTTSDFIIASEAAMGLWYYIIINSSEVKNQAYLANLV